MKATLKSITGFYGAFISMFMSKRTWTPELDVEVESTCRKVVDETGRIRQDAKKEDIEKFNNWLRMLLNMGKKHITVIRFLDMTILTEGMHRAGQDDIDSHAKRFENRIIRNSTRLATYDKGEMSDYYRSKVLTDGEACEILKIGLPDAIEYEGNTYVKSTNGYILKEYENNKDVKRGLYMLSIPCNFIAKINLCEWGHVFKERCANGGANPEVKEWAEQITEQLAKFHEQITRDYVLSIEN